MGCKVPQMHCTERTLGVKSNVTAGMFVGNQMTSVAKNTFCTLDKTLHKPSDIQYIPVCQQFFYFIKVDLHEENSEHTTIKTGEITVTLHLKPYGY